MDQEQKKNKLMNIYQEANKIENKLKVQNLYSLKNILKELSKQQKKTPSTSLHTTASKRNQESKLKITNLASSPKTSYRSNLQLTKRNQWIDLINQKYQQYIQSDQIAITEYRTISQMNTILISDWKQPYQYNQTEIKSNEVIIPHEKIDDMRNWKEILNKRLQKRIS
ncbi:unnamed protein product [Paramecium pentaurelia]|uniref:Uncharacterized protein n=1 Tax=Paramecium pentaurelia TaxID=43138 RepID=A0A8S1VZZ2_9CILI|nr:unnamed protein product [Paramecium pentaurelia]